MTLLFKRIVIVDTMHNIPPCPPLGFRFRTPLRPPSLSKHFAILATNIGPIFNKNSYYVLREVVRA